MAWITAIGSIVAAHTAAQIGKYNADMYNAQSAYWDKKTAVQREVYNKLDRPRLVKKQQSDFSNYFVSLLSSGVEYSGSAYENSLVFQVNQQLDLDIADYNEKIDFIDAKNESILLSAKARGEKFKGQAMAGSEYITAGGTLLGNYYE